MQQIACNELPKQWPTLFRRVVDRQELLEIEGENGETAVIINGRDYHSIIETLYLSSNESNIAWLQESIRQYQTGQVKQIDVTPYLD